jgi:hypothetical protein
MVSILLDVAGWGVVAFWAGLCFVALENTFHSKRKKDFNFF